MQNGALFALRFRDVIFDSWKWRSLKPAEDGKVYTVKAEKPTKKGRKSTKVYAPDLIGKQDSLFCYMRNNVERLLAPSGDLVPDWHLLCDDGSGEIADFIGLSPSQKLVTFVHVKAYSKGNATTISVQPFVEVVSQATKNLRNFDQAILAAGIRERTTPNNKNLVWRHNGTSITRADFCDLLDDLRPAAQRHVILLQPRIFRTTWEKAVVAHRNNSKGAQVGRMLQLSAELSSARNTFGKLGATMEVIGIAP